MNWQISEWRHKISSSKFPRHDFFLLSHSKKQDGHNIYLIMEKRFPSGYHHNGFVVILAAGHHVPKCMNYHKAIKMITRNPHCFHYLILCIHYICYKYVAYTYYIYNIYIIYIKNIHNLCNLYIHIYIYIYIYIIQITILILLCLDSLSMP